MKISNKKLLENSQTIRQVSQKQLPVKVSYAISKNAAKFDAELATYEQERQKLLDKYAERGQDGKLLTTSDGISVKFKNAAAEAGFKKDIDTLLGIENDINVRKVKLSDLEGCQFSAAELAALDAMIEE